MKIAVQFPGIGYHCDKPLLYYSGKLCAQYQYEVIRIAYAGLSRSIPEAFAGACEQTEKMLENVDWGRYEDILFVSKSIGTAVAASYAQKHGIHCRNIYYTPLAQTFDFTPQSGIAFHGTKDTWVETAVIREKCQEYRLPLHIIENTNHSLELLADDSSASPCAKDIALQNIRILENVMELSEQYIANGID